MPNWNDLRDAVRHAPDVPWHVVDLGPIRISNYISAQGAPYFTIEPKAELLASLDAPAPLSLVVGTVIVPYGDSIDGRLVRAATAIPWKAIVNAIDHDPMAIKEIDPYKWEELIAAAFDKAGFEEVTLTPKSRDRGRDVIATKFGFGSVRILGSVKAYKPGHLVALDDVRALMGVLAAEVSASKGMLLTTSEFAPGVRTDPFISRLLPYRIELMNGAEMLAWFRSLSAQGK